MNKNMSIVFAQSHLVSISLLCTPRILDPPEIVTDGRSSLCSLMLYEPNNIRVQEIRSLRLPFEKGYNPT